MNRIDRLTAILLILQRGKSTASEIAQRFEVSRRTILRDMQALSEMGIPIIADLGNTGGYSLPSDYTLPPLALTLHEALLLRLALSGLAQLTETPFKQERETLMTKVQTLLPQSVSDNLNVLQQTIALNVPTRPYPTPFLDLLLESAQKKQWLSVTYRSKNGDSQQTILPMHLRTSAGLWYCEAYSYERQETRIYRVDRFLNVQKTTEPPRQEQPIASIAHFHPSFPEITIRLTTKGIFKLEHNPYLGPYLQHEKEGEGWLKVHLRPEEYNWLIGVLLSLGTDAQVIAPEELRLRVQQTAQEIADHHNQK